MIAGEGAAFPQPFAFFAKPVPEAGGWTGMGVWHQALGAVGGTALAWSGAASWALE